MVWTLMAIALAGVVAFPILRERRRTPVSVRRAQSSDDTADDTGEISTSGTVALSDGVTWYRWYGPDSDSVIVLIHGLTTPSWVFAGLIRGLVLMGYQVLAYDLYGRGLSDRRRDRQTPQFFLRQLSELLDALGLEGPVSLLGYSMGGAIASLFAASYPERVDRLVLLASAGIDYAPKEPLRSAGVSGRLGDWLWSLAGARKLVRAARAEAAGPTVIVDIAERMARETGTRGYLRSVLSAHRETLLVDLEDVHRDVGLTDIPVLAIWGGADATIPATSIGKLTQWNRRIRHHVVEGAGHGLPHSAPSAVIAAITAFLRDVPARAPSG